MFFAKVKRCRASAGKPPSLHWAVRPGTSATLLLLLLVIVADSGLAAGPSYDCEAAKAPLAQLICTNPELSRLDLEFAQAYLALRHQLDETDRRALVHDAAAFQASVLRTCRIPASGQAPLDSSNVTACIAPAYQRQRDAWVARLSGVAREEATRPTDQHIALQRDLRTLGYLPATALLDGVYGAETRAAIVAWQQAKNKPPMGLLGDADAAALDQQAMQAVPTKAEPSEISAGGEPSVSPGSVRSNSSDGVSGAGGQRGRDGTASAGHQWYLLTNGGQCVSSQIPRSPAEVIEFDRQSGLKDSVLVFQTESGEPVGVKVGEPQGNGMESVYTFFRDKEHCETYEKQQREGLEKLN